MEMDLNKFKDKLFARGQEYNFSEMELYKNKNRSFNLRVFNQEIDHYAINEDEGFALRALKDGKMGYAYTEKLDQQSVNILLRDVSQNAEIIDKKEEEEIYAGSEEYKDFDPYQEKLASYQPEEKIKLLKQLEKEALERDERISSVNYCLYSDLEFAEKIINSKGLDLAFRNNIAYMYISVVAREKDQIKTASRFFITQDFEEFDAVKLAHQAADEAISLFGASPIASGSYPVILRYDVAADFLAAFSSTLSAENVQKGLSLFKGKIGQKVASDNLIIVDDPFFEKGFQVTPFDGEGVATACKNVIENGVLTTFLHNLKTARKDGVKSTGNAYRGSHKSYIDIAPSNMYIKPGETDQETMISSISEGVLVTELQGLHSGTNAVSGDFSLGAAGFYIKDGQIERPVEQITIAGNFLEMLKEIEVIGEDLKMSIPGSSHIGAPSLKITSLDIAGE